MAAIRKKCRPKQAKRKRADDGKPYLDEHSRKTEHWSGRQRTQSRDKLQHKAVATVMTKKLKEDTDVEQLHTNAVKVVFKERKLDHVYHFMDTTTQKKVCPQVPLNRLSWNSFRTGWMPMTNLAT